MPLLPADYVNFLASVTPENQDEFLAQMRRFNLGAVGEADCPVFDGLFEYSRVGAGAVSGSAAQGCWQHCACLQQLPRASAPPALPDDLRCGPCCRSTLGDP